MQKKKELCLKKVNILANCNNAKILTIAEVRRTALLTERKTMEDKHLQNIVTFFEME